VKVDATVPLMHLDDRFQEFHEQGERTMMIEEIANLRDQVILLPSYFLEFLEF